MIGRIALGAAVSLCLVAAARAEPPAGAVHPGGAWVFQKWCAPCHAAGSEHPGTVALGVKYAGQNIPAVLEQRTDLKPETVKYYVRHGISVMPIFRKTEITDAELDALAHYLAKDKVRGRVTKHR